MKVIRTTVHYEDGTSSDFLPADAAVPTAPAPVVTSVISHLVTADLVDAGSAHHDEVYPGPVTRIEFDMEFVAGSAPAGSKRIQILGAAGHRGPAKPWVNRDMLIYLILVDQKTWRLRHGVGLSQGEKLTDEGSLQVQPGDVLQVKAGVDLLEHRCWARIGQIWNTRNPLRLEFPINRGDLEPTYDKNFVVRFGEPGVHGDEGPWLGARYSGSVEAY